LRFVRGENPILASFLQQGRAFVSGNEVKIAFASGSFVLERVSEPETKGALLELLRKFGGGEAKLEVVTTEEVPSSVEEERRGEEEGEEETLLKDVLEIFGGKVIQVRERG